MSAIFRNIILLGCLQFYVNNTESQIITTIIGTGIAGYTGDGGPASAAQLNHPNRIIFDASGNKYIADGYNHVVRKINTSGIITTIAGNGHGFGTPNGGYSGDGGPATNAELSQPYDLVFDTMGNLYIGEFGNHVIRRIGTDGIITTIAGTGVLGYSGDGGSAIAAKISDPLGLVFDNSGNLYFSQNGLYRVRKINTAGVISTIAGNGSAGYSGDSGPATSAQVRLTGYLALDASGDLYIPDYANHRIRKIDALGIISTVIGTGVAANSGDGGSASMADIKGMWAILFDNFGNMYISGILTPAIRKIDVAGIITTIAGTGVIGYGGDGGPAISAQFNQEMHCSAIDTWGNLYIADPYNHRIRRITYDYSAVDNVTSGLLDVNIYPNPSNDEITISTTVEANEVAVINMSGHVVMTPSVSSKNKTVVFKVAILPSGMYFVKVNGVYAGKFVKK